jgi:hypothetical protein
MYVEQEPALAIIAADAILIGVVAAADPEQRRIEAQRFSASRTQDNRGRRRKADGQRLYPYGAGVL